MLTGWLMLVVVVVTDSITVLPTSVMMAFRTVCWPSIQTVYVSSVKRGARYRLLSDLEFRDWRGQ